MHQASCAIYGPHTQRAGPVVQFGLFGQSADRPSAHPTTLWSCDEDCSELYAQNQGNTPSVLTRRCAPPGHGVNA
eukprot:scaffold5434_cov59-Phaeocystis_antarctica.AAC.3